MNIKKTQLLQVALNALFLNSAFSGMNFKNSFHDKSFTSQKLAKLDKRAEQMQTVHEFVKTKNKAAEFLDLLKTAENSPDNNSPDVPKNISISDSVSKEYVKLNFENTNISITHQQSYEENGKINLNAFAYFNESIDLDISSSDSNSDIQIQKNDQ